MEQHFISANADEKVILHKMTSSEIKYGILSLRKIDGTAMFFLTIPDAFTIILRGEKLYYRNTHMNRIWLGVKITHKIKPGEILQIFKKNKIIYIN